MDGSRPPVRHFHVPVLALLLGVLCGGGGPILAVQTGRLEGTVRLGSHLTARRMDFSLYADPARPGRRPAPASAEGERQNVVVYLETAPPGAHATPQRARAVSRIEQHELTFKPHVLPVVAGATVEFPNRDLVFHNVFSLSKAASFDLGRYPSGQSRSVHFPQPGVVKVFCHIHSEMSAIVLVLEHPFFATPDEEGRYAIPGIPPGTHRVVGWHERARPVIREVRVEAGQVAALDLDIPLELETAAGD